MKPFLLFALFFGTALNTISGAPKPMLETPDYVIIEEQVVLLYPTNYMSALYVKAELLDGSGNVQATKMTQPGRPVSFIRNDATHSVRSTYHMDSGQEIIIVDEIPE